MECGVRSAPERSSTSRTQAVAAASSASHGLGADKVSIVYRRSRAEMPARGAEIHHAEEEGLNFELLVNPVRYLGNEKGRLTGMECVRMELGEPDASGRRRPVTVPGSEFTIECHVCLLTD